MRPTCFHLGSQDSLRSERQQTDNVVDRAVGLLSKIFSQLQGIVSVEKKMENATAVWKMSGGGTLQQGQNKATAPQNAEQK